MSDDFLRILRKLSENLSISDGSLRYVWAFLYISKSFLQLNIIVSHFILASYHHACGRQKTKTIPTLGKRLYPRPDVPLYLRIWLGSAFLSTQDTGNGGPASVHVLFHVRFCGAKGQARHLIIRRNYTPSLIAQHKENSKLILCVKYNEAFRLKHI